MSSRVLLYLPRCSVTNSNKAALAREIDHEGVFEAMRCLILERKTHCRSSCNSLSSFFSLVSASLRCSGPSAPEVNAAAAADSWRIAGLTFKEEQRFGRSKEAMERGQKSFLLLRRPNYISNYTCANVVSEARSMRSLSPRFQSNSDKSLFWRSIRAWVTGLEEKSCALQTLQ